MADVVVFCVLFVAVLFAATVQISATISATADIADRHPGSLAESRHQREELRLYGNQAEMSMTVSSGAPSACWSSPPCSVGRRWAAVAIDDGEVDTLLPPRVLMLWLFSFLLLLAPTPRCPLKGHRPDLPTGGG